MQIRQEGPADHGPIAAVTEAAFGKPQEARMIGAIRASDGFVPELSLVAEEDRGIVGHIILSYVGLEPSGRQVLELGPMSVVPERQRSGIGSALVREALRIADARHEPLVLVLGHPRFYPRFGFRPSRALGITPADPSLPDEVFMVVPLRTYEADIRGRVVLPPAFAAD